MLFLAVAGFILLNILGIAFMTRSTAVFYVWYTLFQWGYLSNDAPNFMVLPGVLLVLSTGIVLIWDVIRLVSLLKDKKHIF